MKKILILSILMIGLLSFSGIAEAKGSSGSRSGGSRSVGSSRSSGARTSAPKTTAPKVSTPKIPQAPNITKPSSKTQTKTAPMTKKVNGKTYSKKGYVVGDGYQPRFTGGYMAPAGSTVYYRSSMWDWFPMYYILTHDSHKEAVVATPDGKETVVKEEGKDGMYFVNWILTILIALGLIGAVMYFINKSSKKKYV